MDATLQSILQGGALALLAFIIVWVAKSGGPKLFEALNGITRAIDKNSASVNTNTDQIREMRRDVRELQRTNGELVRVVGKVAEATKVVGEATLTELQKHEQAPSDPDR